MWTEDEEEEMQEIQKLSDISEEKNCAEKEDIDEPLPKKSDAEKNIEGG